MPSCVHAVAPRPQLGLRGLRRQKWGQKRALFRGKRTKSYSLSLKVMSNTKDRTDEGV